MVIRHTFYNNVLRLALSRVRASPSAKSDGFLLSSVPALAHTSSRRFSLLLCPWFGLRSSSPLLAPRRQPGSNRVPPPLALPWSNDSSFFLLQVLRRCLGSWFDSWSRRRLRFSFSPVSPTVALWRELLCFFWPGFPSLCWVQDPNTAKVNVCQQRGSNCRPSGTSGVSRSRSQVQVP